MLLFRQRLSQPSHGPVQMVQAQSAGAFDSVALFPLLRRAVAAGSEEPMQHSDKDGSLDGELKAAVFKQRGQHRVDRTALPEALEDQGWADPGASRNDALAGGVSAEDREFFRVFAKGLDQRVEFAAGQEFIETAKTKQDALFDFTVNALVIDDEEIGSGTVGLSANEHSGYAVPLL